MNWTNRNTCYWFTWLKIFESITFPGFLKKYSEKTWNLSLQWFLWHYDGVKILVTFSRVVDLLSVKNWSPKSQIQIKPSAISVNNIDVAFFASNRTLFRWSYHYWLHSKLLVYSIVFYHVSPPTILLAMANFEHLVVFFSVVESFVTFASFSLKYFEVFLWFLINSLWLTLSIEIILL